MTPMKSEVEIIALKKDMWEEAEKADDEGNDVMRGLATNYAQALEWVLGENDLLFKKVGK